MSWSQIQNIKCGKSSGKKTKVCEELRKESMCVIRKMEVEKPISSFFKCSETNAQTFVVTKYKMIYMGLNLGERKNIWKRIEN